jgi:hypothetical protein
LARLDLLEADALSAATKAELQRTIIEKLSARLAALEGSGGLSDGKPKEHPMLASSHRRLEPLSSSFYQTVVGASGIYTRTLNVSNLNIVGDMTWHGTNVHFNPAPTREPTAPPTAAPTLEPTPAHWRTTLIQNGYALVGRASGPGTSFVAGSSHWASTSTISPDTCGSCTTDIKHHGWSTLVSNEVMLCFGSEQANCASFTHGKGKTLQALFQSNTFVMTTESWTFATLRAALGVSSPDWSNSNDLGQFCGLNLGFEDVLTCAQVNPNTQSCGSAGVVLRIGCIGDMSTTGIAGCTGGPNDQALGVGVTSCASKDNVYGNSCYDVGCVGNLHFMNRKDPHEDTILGTFSNTAYIWVRL